MLVHDDIIDKSSLRRGKPSMHAMLNAYMRPYQRAKFNGQDLAIVVGDVMYALALHSFLAINVDAARKEQALKKLIEAALYTGSGEFLELLCGLKTVETIRKQDIYRIYDLKTAYYTFACPLAMGAILAGAPKQDIDKLLKFGVYVGRAFQIKDDIIGMFESEELTGKSNLADLQESKNTLLIWYAYTHASTNDKKRIKTILTKQAVTFKDLRSMRKIVVESGSLAFAKKEVATLLSLAQAFSRSTRISPRYQSELIAYAQSILAL
jgi:geranylgeranyl diphosphate synthase type I